MVLLLNVLFVRPVTERGKIIERKRMMCDMNQGIAFSQEHSSRLG